MRAGVWAYLGILGEGAEMSGRFGYLVRTRSGVWMSLDSWALLLKYVGVLGGLGDAQRCPGRSWTLGEWGQTHGGPGASLRLNSQGRWP